MKIFKPTNSTAINVTILSLAGLVLITSATIIFLPNIVRLTATNWLSNNGFTSSIETIEINLFDSQVEINNATGTNSEGRGFSIGKIYLDFSWTPLQDQEIVITGIELADISITIRKINEDLYISGIPLTSRSTDDLEAVDTPEEVPQEVHLPWNVSLEKLQLSNINVCYQQSTTDSSNTTAPPVIQQDVCFDLGSLHWKGQVDYTLTEDQAKHPFNINGNISISEITIKNNHFDAASLSYDQIKLGGILLNLHDAPDPEIPTLLPLKVDNLEFTGINSCFQKSKNGAGENPLDGYCLLLDKFNWAGAIGYSPAATPADKTLLHAEGTLALESINLTNKHLGKNALSIGELRFDEILVTSPDDIRLAELSIHNFGALQKDKTTNKSILGFDSLSIAQISLKNQNKVTIDTISLDGLQVAFEKLKNGKLEHEQWLPKTSIDSKTAAGNSTTIKTGAKTETFNYSINSTNITNSKTISFTDNSLVEPFSAVISKTQISISTLDSTRPNKNTSLKLTTKIYEHGSLKTSGTISPLASELTFDLKGELRGLDLRKFNPYVKPSISHIIENGQLDSDLILKSDKGQLDSNVDLTLQRFDLEPLSDEATKELNDTFGLPLNPSLALIRERDGSINIDVDIKGDAENPNINPIEIVTKAISTSIAKAVVVLYSPYGLVVGADMLFSLATALEFDPVDFDAGSTKINTSNTEEFTNLSNLLKDKPQVHIKLCGYTNNKDTIELFDVDTQKDQNIKLSDEQLDELVILAKQRAAATKRHLIEKEDVAAARIIVCTHKRKGAGVSEISGVEISL